MVTPNFLFHNFASRGDKRKMGVECWLVIVQQKVISRRPKSNYILSISQTKTITTSQLKINIQLQGQENISTPSNSHENIFPKRRYSPTNIEFLRMPSRHQSLTRDFNISEDYTPSAISLDTCLLLRISKCIAHCSRNSCHHVIVGSHVEKDRSIQCTVGNERENRPLGSYVSIPNKVNNQFCAK